MPRKPIWTARRPTKFARESDYQRYEALAKKDLVSKQQRDTAEANWKMALAQKQSAQHRLDELKRGYRPEEIAAAEARYHQTQATLEKFERGNRPEDIAAARAALALDEARYPRAPGAGSGRRDRGSARRAPRRPDRAEYAGCHSTRARPDLCAHLRSGNEIGHVQVGQKAEITWIRFPTRIFQGVVEQINQQAEFLPRNVQTREERVHQVFGVKVRIDDSTHRVRAGMAADVKLAPKS